MQTHTANTACQYTMNIRTIPMCDMMLIRQIITLYIAPPELTHQVQDRSATQC
ncbi:hypothetical protein N9802_02315 [Amylibacter sp.]|nr:hypothetical protein [Amylibacter sp.]